MRTFWPREQPRRLLRQSEYDNLIGLASNGFWRQNRLKVPKMALSSQDVERLARLARIEITPAEAAEVGDQLARIFDLIGRLRAVDTSGIVPMAHAQEVSLPLREDIVTEIDRHELYQASAPAVSHGLYLVPRVIE